MRNIIYVKASDIDLAHAQGMNNDHFWKHHGNNKATYMEIAERIPDVQKALDSGNTVAELMQDPALKDTVKAYFFTPNMIQVKQCADGRVFYIDDGRHRIHAAAEFGFTIPVCVVELESVPTVPQCLGNIWLHTSTAEMGLFGLNRKVAIAVPAEWVKEVIERGPQAVANMAALAIEERTIVATSSKRINNRLGPN